MGSGPRRGSEGPGSGSRPAAARMPASRPESELPGPTGFLGRLGAQFDRFFEDVTGALARGVPPGSWREVFRGEPFTFPTVEILSRDDELVVRADLPGLKREDVKVELGEGVLTIEGERRHEEGRREGNVHQCERSYGSFRRSIPLPVEADPGSAAATFRDGVLEVVMKSRTPRSSARRIDIRPGS